MVLKRRLFLQRKLQNQDKLDFILRNRVHSRRNLLLLQLNLHLRKNQNCKAMKDETAFIIEITSMSKSLIKCTSHNRLSRCDTPSSLTTRLHCFKINQKSLIIEVMEAIRGHWGHFESLRPVEVIRGLWGHSNFNVIFWQFSTTVEALEAIIESFFGHPRFSTIFCNVCLLECTRCALTHFFAGRQQQHHWENSHCRRERRAFCSGTSARWIHTRQGKVTWRVHHEEPSELLASLYCGMIVPFRRWPSPKIITMWQFTSRQLDTELSLNFSTLSNWEMNSHCA